MKQVLFSDMYSWSVFSEPRQIDFNGHLWRRPDGNVLIDPVAMTAADLEQFDALGGAAFIWVYFGATIVSTAAYGLTARLPDPITP